MLRLRRYWLSFCATSVFLTVAGVSIAQIDGSTYEAEDFEVVEEGMMFDHARTGLHYPRNLYTDGDNVTFVPSYPTAHNDTNYVREWKIYVSHWEQDPPNFINVFMMDDSPYFPKTSEIDLRVAIGHADRNRNLIAGDMVVVRNIQIQSGINRVPIPIHNYKGDIVSVNLIGVRQKLPYQAIEVVGE